EPQVPPGQMRRGLLVRKDRVRRFLAGPVLFDFELARIEAGPVRRDARRNLGQRLSRLPPHLDFGVLGAMRRMEKRTALTAGKVMKPDGGIGALLDEVRVMVGIAG